MNAQAKITAATAVQRDYYAIWLAARGLAEVAMLASKVPNYPELAEQHVGYAELVEERLANLEDVKNGA